MRPPGRLRIARAGRLGLVWLLVAGGAGEGLVRLAIRTNARGWEVFFQQPVRPFPLPVQAVERDLADLASGQVRLVYDPDLGWAPLPDHTTADGLYHTNAQGIRTDVGAPPFSPSPEPGTLRVALVGDSFTQGNEVPFSQTWGHLLEEELRVRGIRAEVLNFGVGGYGLDQALLRYRKHARPLSPQLVLLGVMPEDATRCRTLHRYYYGAHGLPFTKPRFVRDALGDGFHLVNRPTLPARELPSLVAHPEAPMMRDGDVFSVDYRPTPLLASRFAALLVSTVVGAGDPDAPLAEPETLDLAAWIARTLADEAKRDGARFAMVHMPGYRHVHDLLAGRRHPPHHALAERLRGEGPLIDAEPAVLAIARRKTSAALFAPQGHYRPIGHQAVAEVVAAAIARMPAR